MNDTGVVVFPIGIESTKLPFLQAFLKTMILTHNCHCDTLLMTEQDYINLKNYLEYIGRKSIEELGFSSLDEYLNADKITTYECHFSSTF